MRSLTRSPNSLLRQSRALRMGPSFLIGILELTEGKWELTSRLVKDIVSEKSSYYHPVYSEGVKVDGGDHPLSQFNVPGSIETPGGPLTFNLPRFIPLLHARITVMAPQSRMFLAGWINVLLSADLEMVEYFPEVWRWLI